MADPINVVVDRIPIRDYSYSICRHNDALYLAANGLQRVDLPTRTVKVVVPGVDALVLALVDFHQPIPLPPDVLGAGAPDRRIYIPSTDYRIVEVQPAILDQFDSFPVGPYSAYTEQFVCAIVGSNDARLLYLCDAYRERVVVVVDLHRRRAVGSIEVGSLASDIVVSPDDRFLYTAHPEHDYLSVIDTAVWPPAVTRVPVDNGPYGLAMSADGNRLFVAQAGEFTSVGTFFGPGSLSVFDTSTMQGSWVHTGDGSGSVLVNTAGTRAYVCNEHSESVSVVDVTGAPEVVATINGLKSPGRMCFNADESRLYVTQWEPTNSSIAVVAI